MPKGKDRKRDKDLKKTPISIPQESSLSHNNRSIWLPIIVLTLISFGLYWNTYSFEFVLDDTLVLSENNYVKKGFSGIGKILTTESFEGYFGEQKNLVEGARYRPLSLITFRYMD